MMLKVFANLGESDCETIGSGLFAQPVNALSSLAFSAVGVVIMVWALSAKGHERIVRIVFGVLMLLTGIGSVLFHGPQGSLSQFGHDITFLVTILFLAVLNVSESYGWNRPLGWSVFVAGTLILGVSLLLSPAVTNVLMIVVVVMLVVADIAIHRRGRVRTSWYVASLVLTAVAVAMFLLGRTGGPLCDPDALFQGHALWHVLGAFALGGYFVATSDARVYEERLAA